MIYITVKQSPMYHQMTLEEFLFPSEHVPRVINNNETNTRTYAVENVSSRFSENIDVAALIEKLKQFNESTSELRKQKRSDLYETFYIPKKSHGFRRIDAPNDDLKASLNVLKSIFENDFHALYHTSAFAYIKKRSTLDAVKRHQSNESKWFGKFDLSGFFNNTTLEFVMNQLAMIYPFNFVINDVNGKRELETALELGFLNGGLPQGTPLSPLITNIMMIPIDYRLANSFRKEDGFVYTRYADDFLISSRRTFDIKLLRDKIVSVLHDFNAPFTINSEKTRYGSSAGSNWNLGVMLNKDNEITIGHKKKRVFNAMLTAYVMDTKSGNKWDISDIQVLEGYRNYYRMVERKSIDEIVSHLSEKFDFDIVESIKSDLRS